MSDYVIRKGPPPPPPPPRVLAHRRKQKRMIAGALAAILLGAGAVGGYVLIGDPVDRAEKEIESGLRFMTPGQYSIAIPYFSRALELDPNSWNAYYQRAVANQNEGEASAAESDYRSALELNPDLVQALSALAGIHRDAGQKEQAIEEFTRAIELSPTTDAYFQRGSTYQELGQHEKAIDDFTWVINAMRDVPFVYYARATSKRALGDFEGATQDEATAKSFDRASKPH